MDSKNITCFKHRESIYLATNYVAIGAKLCGGESNIVNMVRHDVKMTNVASYPDHIYKSQ